LNLRIVEPEVNPDDRWLDDPDGCCAARKVVPMAKALAGRTAWMTGLRRDEAPTRTKTPVVGYDVGRGMVKINPIADWTEIDVQRYAQDRSLPEHPLREKGYASIGGLALHPPRRGCTCRPALRDAIQLDPKFVHRIDITSEIDRIPGGASR